MSIQETRPTTYKIFSNGDFQPEFPGVSDDSIYDSRKQIYVPRERFNQVIKPKRNILPSRKLNQ